MAINPHFPNLYFLNPNLDELSKFKECVHDATDAFLQFCNNCIGPYLENDLLKPHLQTINELCIYETNSDLLVHLVNIHTILQKDPHLLEAYMTIIQNVNNISSDLLELDQIADDALLIKKHLQIIQEIGKLNNSTLLEIHLKTIKKLKNNLNIELYLKSIHSLCNFQPQLLNSYLLTNNFIYHLELSFFEIHLRNMNNIPLYFLENYINTICNIENHLKILKLYIHTISIINHDLLETHQQNIYRFPLRILEIYLERILQLENSKTLLEHCTKGIYHVNDTQDIQHLEFHFENIYSINCFHTKLLTPYLQNIFHLDAFTLSNYIQAIHDTKSYQDRACTIYYMHNFTYISQSQPDLIDLYNATCQTLENNQKSLFFFSYITYFISQKHPKALKQHLKIIQFLENTKSDLTPLYIKNIHSEPDLLIEYISKILWIEINNKVHSSFYISSIYIAYFIAQKHFDLTTLYNESCMILESKQENLLFHLYLVFYISQKHPQLLQSHLEIVLFLANTSPRLLWPHFTNIQKSYHSDANFFNEYIAKTSDLKNNSELLLTHICHTFNTHHIKNQHFLLLKLYKLIIKFLENNPKKTSCHVYHTYRISILLPDYLKIYLKIFQKTIALPQNDPKCVWLNHHLQNMQEFKDSIVLEKYLQLISQVDAIFEGKMFLKEEIIKNMNEEEKKAFMFLSPTIMPYVIAKTIFLYVFHNKYSQSDPCFFPSEVKQEILILRKETHKYTISKIQNIFKKLTHPNEVQSKLEENMESPLEKIQDLWMNSIQEENNVFMQCWKEAVLDLT